MVQTVQGVIHGKTIELVLDPGFQPGQAVEVVVKESPTKPRVWGEGIMRSAGAFAGTEEDDRILAEIEWERKHGPERPPLEPLE
jgi:hypothetical protein